MKLTIIDNKLQIHQNYEKYRQIYCNKIEKNIHDRRKKSVSTLVPQSRVTMCIVKRDSTCLPKGDDQEALEEGRA